MFPHKSNNLTSFNRIESGFYDGSDEPLGSITLALYI